jgi:6-pyruvoyltetrahydropterin/6-carboxytetrahydropterin synthase
MTNQMKYIISKEFSFEAAHRLLRNYTGKCTNNHGHSFKVKIYLEGNSLDEKDMLIDFQETKALKSWVNDHLDHVTILWEGDPLIQSLQATNNKVMVTKKNPTSEHIAEIVLKKAQELFENTRIRVHCIEINETCTTGAKIYP